ncbi:MAG: hypothetical protein N2320_05065 [Candidatus Bipolaricaulota bacterium]|nr:hypothetical protein [Candidatus Bipolaricaulota bacterium]
MGVALGLVPKSVPEKMKEGDYDFAPVFTDDDVLGLVARTRLEELAELGHTLVPDDPALQATAIEANPPLDALLDAMAQFPARIVVATPGSSPPWPRRDTYGIVTLSDLNKHPLRVVIYEILAELEMVAADLVRAAWGNSIDWVTRLGNEDSQARILGYWTLGKMRGVDTGPVTGATLSELLRAIGKHEGTLAALGFPSRNKWQEATDSLPSLRNRVMHPVRPLVVEGGECAELKGDLATALDLTRRIRSRLEGQRS